MKTKLSLMIAGIVVISALGFYVFAQTQNSPQGIRTGRGSGIGSGTGPYVVGNGVVPASADVVLCKPDGVVIDKSFPRTGTLRIEYKNGSMSQIDLTDVKKMTVVPIPSPSLPPVDHKNPF
jgi:hypothetical protein